jgi:NAD(P)-dependent dehydrogenase (short-subunit alcohol dehydrogenase family)
MDRSVVLVTGASHGLGQAAAALLAAHGYQVFGTARKPASGSADGVQMLPLDVTSPESVASCVAEVTDRAGHIDVLVNNAGAGLIGAIEETPSRTRWRCSTRTCSAPPGWSTRCCPACGSAAAG